MVKVKKKTQRKPGGKRRKLDAPAKILVPIFFSAVALTVFMAFSAPGLYRALTQSAFDEALFVNDYKDRLYSYGTHPQLRSIQVNSSSNTIVASQAGRGLDEVIGLYQDGKNTVALVALLTGILGGTLLTLVLLYFYTKKGSSRMTMIVVAILIGTMIFVNWINVLYHSTQAREAYLEVQPQVRANLALLSYIAIQENELELMQKLVGMSVPVDAVDDEQGSYMHHVAVLNRLDMFPLLMAVPGINLDNRNVAGETPIQVASEKGFIELVTLLLENDVDAVNKNGQGETLLHHATRNGDLPLMRLLLKNADTLNTPDVEGVTPLSLAVQHADMEMVLLLLESGADINTQVDEKYTFFELIISVILEELRAVPEYTLDNEDEIFDTITRAIGQNAELSGQDEEGNTPLHWVTRLHDSITKVDDNNPFLSRMTLLLLENDADFVITNTAGEQAITLEHVIRHNYDDWLVPVVEANPGYLNQAVINGRSLFQYAIELGNAETLAALFERGLEPKEWVPKSMIPLKFVVENNDLATARLLLEQKLAVPNNNDSTTDSPIHLAARLNHDRMIELLLEYGYNVNIQGIKGNTPLHYALETGSTFSILVLVENGADPLIWNSEGERPIDLAKDLGDATIKAAMKNAADNFKQKPAPKQ